MVLAVVLGLSSAFFLLCMPSLWLSLEAGAAALVTAVLILLILADVIVEVVALAEAYLAAGAVAGVLAGALLAVVVVVTATPEAVPEIARGAGGVCGGSPRPLQRVVWGGGGCWLRYVCRLASCGATVVAS